MHCISMSRRLLSSCIKRIPLKIVPIFPLQIKVSFRAKLLSDVSGGFIRSSDNPLDYHAKITK